MIENFPFMLSVSKHSAIFFSNLLALLLLLELLELSILLLDLSLLCRQLLLHGLFLLLPCLHLVADQSAADQTDCSADARTGTGISCSAPDDGAQAGSGKSSDSSAFLPRRQRLRTAQKKRRYRDY